MYIIRKAVKELALREAEKRHHNFTRVGSSFLDDVDAQLLLIVQRKVRAHPSKGKTLMA